MPGGTLFKACEDSTQRETLFPRKYGEFLDTHHKGLSNREVTKDSPQSSSLRNVGVESRHLLRCKIPSARSKSELGLHGKP